jgi:KUP system potassium uptake protein
MAVPEGGPAAGEDAAAAPLTTAAARRPPTLAGRGQLPPLALAALGVVYGDIGTSPLYALAQCLDFVAGTTARADAVLGVLSLVFWALTLVVSVKYLSVIMRVDNQGEGGIFALLALVGRRARIGGPDGSRAGAVLAGLGVFGAALLYGDGVITPAISVLSAVEGLGVATDALEPFVVPTTVCLLVALFSAQRFGTGGVARLFGPIMLVWFVTIGGLGLARIVAQAPDHASVLWALDPRHGVRLLLSHGWRGFFVLGSVVLAITGAEALYADLGHFGARPIRVAWSAVVFPALVLNYLGQGALILEHGEHLEHPFFDLAPAWGLYPLVALSTVATIVASQALISGAFSLTQQASQLGYAPRLTVVHTSSSAPGQIYVPRVNQALMLACVALVLAFRSSDALASAYGIAVTGTMSVTSILFYVVARRRLGWSRLVAGSLVGAFLLVDLSFFAGNADKLTSGGWLPIAIALVVFAVMTTWKKGRDLLSELQSRRGRPVGEFLASLEASSPPRVPGTAVYLSTNAEGIPALLVHNLEANGVLHERVVLLAIASSEVPKVPDEERVSILDMGRGFFRVIAFFGFMESPALDEVLERSAVRGLAIDTGAAVFFVARDTLLTGGPGALARWRKRLFALLWRNVPSTIDTLRLPARRVVELGVQIEL